jgi:hypothetical protein
MDKKEPYGNVEYADSGFRGGVKRYPIDTADHVRAAWSYINQAKNAAFYDAKQLKHIKDAIEAAAEKHGVEIADDAAEMGAESVSLEDTASLLASVAPLAPPSAWFVDPRLAKPTPLTIDDNGHVFGHLAQWKKCHVGIGNKCVMAPKTRTDYRLFRVGTVRTDDGKTVPIGKITLGTGHANDRWGIIPSREHYDNTGWAAAVVNVGEDRHGIWINGSLTTTMTPERIAELRAASLSGDWREVDYNLELIAALAVNSPGFPIYREQAGHAFSLMAVGVIGMEEEEQDMDEENTEFSSEEMQAAVGNEYPADDVMDDAGELAARIERWQQIEDDLAVHQTERRMAQLAAIDDERMALAEKSAREVPASAAGPVAASDAIFVQYNARFMALQEDEE